MLIKKIDNNSELDKVYKFIETNLNLPKDRVRNLNFYKKALKTSPQFLIYAEEDNEIKGALLGIPEGSDGILIGELAVSEDSRGRGVGSLLLDEIENIAKNNEKKSILLGSLETSEKFYEKHAYLPKLFIQLTGSGRLNELKDFTNKYKLSNQISWENEDDSFSKIIIDTGKIDVKLQEKANKIPDSHTQFLFFKEILMPNKKPERMY